MINQRGLDEIQLSVTVSVRDLISEYQQFMAGERVNYAYDGRSQMDEAQPDDPEAGQLYGEAGGGLVEPGEEALPEDEPGRPPGA